MVPEGILRMGGVLYEDGELTGGLPSPRGLNGLDVDYVTHLEHEHTSGGELARTVRASTPAPIFLCPFTSAYCIAG